MPDKLVEIVKDPINYSWLTYLWVVGISSAGGLVSFLRKRKDMIARPFNFAELLGEMFTAAFVGVVTFFLCEWSGTPPMLSAALIAISGHMGSRALFGLEQVFETKFGVKAPRDDNA